MGAVGALPRWPVRWDSYVTRDYKNIAAEVIAQPSVFVLSLSGAPAALGEAVPEAGPPSSVSVSPVVPAPSAELAAPPSAATGARVSVQEATLEQLSAVPGLSKKLALEIIKSRPFRSLEELTRVRGIGEKTLRKRRAVLTL